MSPKSWLQFILTGIALGLVGVLVFQVIWALQAQHPSPYTVFVALLYGLLYAPAGIFVGVLASVVGGAALLGPISERSGAKIVRTSAGAGVGGTIGMSLLYALFNDGIVNWAIAAPVGALCATCFAGLAAFLFRKPGEPTVQKATT